MISLTLALKKTQTLQSKCILDSCLEKNADATIKMVGLMCFKTFEEAEQMKGEDFIAVAAELFGNKKIMDFFGTLLGLVQ